MKKFVLTLTIASFFTTSLSAETAPKDVVTTVGVQASTLLESGFAIVAMQHLDTSIVVTLQRANRAFLCELGLDGKTLHCVEIK